jgi:hypothetical protein
MGAGAASSFENEDALDWVPELEDGTVDLVCASLAVTKSDYLESPDGSVAISAAEVIAAAVTYPTTPVWPLHDRRAGVAGVLERRTVRVHGG